jgi:O-antigen/teichoic acid export membrane protein
MIFYTLGSMIYYGCQWLMTVVIVRISGYEAAGVLATALAVCAAPAIVSLFNVRNYQVSDLNGQYSFATYTNARHCTNVLAYVICFGIVLVNGYSFDKALVILAFMLYKLVEGIVDVLYGVEQQREHLDYAGISYAMRGIGTIVVFGIVQVISNSLFTSMLAITCFSLAVVVCYDWRIVRCWENSDKGKKDYTQIFQLLLTCLPLAVVAFLNNLSVNVPKMALERFYGEKVMGFFSSVNSPTLVMQLLAQTIFAPLVTPLTVAFNQRQKQVFGEIIKKFVMMMAVVAICCLFGAVLLGSPVLVFLFGTEIKPYVYLFTPSILVTLLIGVNSALLGICTLIREIKSQYLVGAAGIIVSVVLSFWCVRQYSGMGVVYAQLGSIVIQIALQVVMIHRKLRKTWK